jgi:hypothetical protein
MSNQDKKARLAELRDWAEKQEAARKSTATDRELELLELLHKYTQELGPRGFEFEIATSAADGPIVIKRLDEVAYKKFKAALDSDKGASYEDHYDYVAAGVVHPERAKFDELVGRRPHIVVRLANAMLTLHGAKEASDAGKF